jgi:hypothetical protein
MKLVTDRKDVLGVFDRCRSSGIALFAPNGELPAEIEGLCMGAQKYAEDHNLAKVPVAIGMTPPSRMSDWSCSTSTTSG